MKDGIAGKGGIPWQRIIGSMPVWAIVVNNFTFHNALYVLMNWLPTYFEQADHLIGIKVFFCDPNKEVFEHCGVHGASLSLMALPTFRSSGGAVFCSSMALGFLALGRAGFAVNHTDIAPKYAGIVMGISHTAGTLAGIIGVDLTGKLLEAAKTANSEISNPESRRSVHVIPGVLCIFSSLGFLLLSTGERIFD
ncbi:hypothetical protein L484_013721 [Morus notabilis]|uniref:Anion transporter 6 n=1 Tax=Morus notabilis TaxID=981085 RepID=W9QWC4_9ROSA|nr:hypothetical protein L484_013721 [Morus notabilis]